jgi:hypothetical protein
MKTDIQFDDSVRDDPGYDQYRTMCVAAVTSLLFGVLSLLSFLSPYLSLIPILGIVVGLFALAQIRQRPHELAGRHFARAGIGLASLLLVTSTAREVYIYLTEVPEGHERISYSLLQPEEGKVGQLIPPLAESLNGKKVFIKGYVFPGQQQHGRRFHLTTIRQRLTGSPGPADTVTATTTTSCGGCGRRSTTWKITTFRRTPGYLSRLRRRKSHRSRSFRSRFIMTTAM